MSSLFKSLDPKLYKKKDPNEYVGTRASRNFCICGKPDPNLPMLTDYERIERYKCDYCHRKNG